MKLDVYFNSWPADGPFRPFIDFVLEKAKGKDILDVGCGYGAYSQELNNIGFRCVGIDANKENIKKAVSRGVEAYIGNAENLSFKDKSFNTVIMFEVIEHLKHPEKAVSEAIRVAKKNILITVPNCDEEELDRLSDVGLTFFHLRTKDHCQFFTKESLSALIEKSTINYSIEKKEPIYPHHAIKFRYLTRPISLLYKLRLLRPRYFNRLYAEIIIE